jgi:NADPH:quinone reductase-like Zn-dependent oxidoreductase
MVSALWDEVLMGTPATAAVSRVAGEAPRLESVIIDDPRPGEVLVKLVATGVCHTDMVMRDGHLPVPLPVVLGHEGAGHVVAVGPGLTMSRPVTRWCSPLPVAGPVRPVPMTRRPIATRFSAQLSGQA